MLSTIGSVASQNSLLTWDKYTTLTKYNPIYGERGESIESSLSGWGSGYRAYDWDIATNRWVGTGNDVLLEEVPSGQTFYQIQPDVILKMQWYPLASQYKIYSWFSVGKTPYKVKGTFVATVQAPKDTYPDNGLYSDEFWYIKRI